MKKSIFIAVLGTVSAVACYGQGKINFANYYASTQTTGIKYASGPAAGLGASTEVTAQLYFGASTDTLFSELAPLAGATQLLGFGAVTVPSPIGTGGGWFNFKTVTVDALNGGTTYAFALFASGTFNSVFYSGNSVIADGATSATSGSQTPNLPTAVFHSNFTIAPAPEPTTLALAGLGGLASLLMVRRKKA